MKGLRIKEVLLNENPEAKIYDDMDDALIGIYRNGSIGSGGIYSYIKFVESLIAKGYSEEQAVGYCDDIVNSSADDNALIVDDTGV